MAKRMLGLVAGSLTGMMLGAMLVATMCLGLERYGGVRFTKEPLALIALVGLPLGGFVGGLVGLWSLNDRAGRRGPDDSALPKN